MSSAADLAGAALRPGGVAPFGVLGLPTEPIWDPRGVP